MKPFNLDEAKAGKPVITRDGRDVRIVCFDRKHEDFTILVLIPDVSGIEFGEFFNDKGVCTVNKVSSDYDLFMKSERITGWVNVYPTADLFFAANLSSAYKTKELADASASPDRLNCVEIDLGEKQ